MLYDFHAFSNIHNTISMGVYTLSYLPLNSNKYIELHLNKTLTQNTDQFLPVTTLLLFQFPPIYL